MSDLFQEKAADWDANERIRKLSTAIGSAILENIQFDNKMDVLDFGAGTGLISAHIAPLVNSIIAVDTSAAMLEKLVAKPEFHGKVTGICRNILSEPLDMQFDLIVSAMAMHHVEDTDSLVRTFTRHLKSGGRIALADLDKEDGSFHPADTKGVYHAGFERPALEALLQKYGFINIRFITAHTVEKEQKPYPVFLLTATWHSA